MKILIIGGGGREHAIAWKLKQSRHVTAIFCVPGNAGIASIAECIDMKPADVDAIERFIRKKDVDLTVVGPEAPLADGIVDRFQEKGLKIFGPSRAAARLETSKVFAKQFMQRHHIPTADFSSFSAEQYREAHEHLLRSRYPLVIKADGLAAGKGVIVAENFQQASDALDQMMKKHLFGEAGESVVIEEFMEGIEASVFAITDGKSFATLAPAQDHKRIFDGDKGKNTGGMGAYAPTRFVPPELMSQVKLRIIRPTLEGLAAENTPYTGCLYVGLMITREGPRVVEYNCRFGDPEAQVVLPLIDDDLAEIVMSVAEGKLDRRRIRQHDASAVCVVMASNGYPDLYATGKEISGLDAIDSMYEGIIVFHAGTRHEGSKVVTAGGRVLGVTSISSADDLDDAIRSAYSAVERIRFDGAYYRTDIGKKGLPSGI